MRTFGRCFFWEMMFVWSNFLYKMPRNKQKHWLCCHGRKVYWLWSFRNSNSKWDWTIHINYRDFKDRLATYILWYSLSKDCLEQVKNVISCCKSITVYHESRNEGGRGATPTSISIFDLYDKRNLWFEFGCDIFTGFRMPTLYSWDACFSAILLIENENLYV